MKQFLLMIAVVALVGCGKKEPVQSAASNTGEGSRSEPKVDPTKHERFFWEFETEGYVDSSPAIGSDGTVYVGSQDKKLYAINGKSGVI
jgi:outer membrane protein assembly factor BamB